ncbi:hypothetical protein B0T24DRAFT_605142 [Lasiosphaeria ovina]|uniref:Uncharacterized protein n=1 Tax=Lasiosphaeria ovina TaxID=92902 RepID=A0AAE0TXU5_9PEZI|nr:hypothetical protein B0T24DRAFT_605142 [Lasiosphaeria ovina]
MGASTGCKTLTPDTPFFAPIAQHLLPSVAPVGFICKISCQSLVFFLLARLHTAYLVWLPCRLLFFSAVADHFALFWRAEQLLMLPNQFQTRVTDCAVLAGHSPPNRRQTR